MSIIKILPKHEAQKIAAGEVVERPASVIKELVENSLDAKASAITIHVEKAGKNLIRISDNGTGMSPEDARLCFKPHATSKITSVDELASINSFGFRGEALSSISSISKTTLITKQKEKTLGTKVQLEDGQITAEEEVSTQKGTVFEIKDLFYNIPARKKFLKQDETEWNKILLNIQSFVASHINIQFKLYRDGKLFLNAPPVKNLIQRASQLFGHNFSENLLGVTSLEKEGLSVNGVISNHQFWRYNKNQLFFFVNNRLVKNQELTKGVMKGYLNVLPPDKFPAVILFLKINKSVVDVNVHPRKEEVQFAKPLMVKSAIATAVKNTLSQNVSKNLSHSYGEVKNFNFDSPTFSKPVFSAPIYEHKPTPLELPEAEPIIPLKEEQIPVKQPEQNINIIGQILKTYILIEQENSLVIVDQHAAHERILYEQFASKFEGLEGTRLLFPEIIKMENKYLNLITREKDFFEKVGLELELFGENEIAIKAAPPKIQNQSLKELLLEVAHFIEEHAHLDEETFRKKLTEHTHSHMACKAAVKAGDVLSYTEMQTLISQLKQTDNNLICVHGRPTTWTVTQGELEKKFQRRL